MDSWFANPPDWLPWWIPWLLIIAFVIGMIYKFGFHKEARKGWMTRSKRDALAYVKEERDVFKRRLDELERKEADKDSASVNSRVASQVTEEADPKSSPRSRALVGEEDVVVADEDKVGTSADDYQLAMLAFDEGEYENGKQLLAKAAEKEIQIAKFELLALGYAQAFRRGVREALEDLRTITANHPSSTVAVSSLAQAYYFVGKNEDSLATLRQGIGNAQNEETTVSLTSVLHRILTELDRRAEALFELKKALSNLGEERSKAKIYAAIALMYVEDDNINRAYACYERAIHHDPLNTNLRFDLAYLYGDNNKPRHALYHYLKLLEIESNEAALNNAGVAANAAGLPMFAVAYLRDAIEKGGTLAASTLASKLMSLGFDHEAEELLDEALKAEDVDTAVYSTRAQLDKARRQEVEELPKIQAEVKKHVEWQAKYGFALVQELNPSEVEGQYVGTPANIILHIDEEKKVISEDVMLEGDAVGKLSGELNGSVIEFSWTVDYPKTKELPSNRFMPSLADRLGISPRSQTERGLLFVEDGTLSGFSVSGNSMLEKPTETFKRWELARP